MVGDARLNGKVEDLIDEMVVCAGFALLHPPHLLSPNLLHHLVTLNSLRCTTEPPKMLPGTRLFHQPARLCGDHAPGYYSHAELADDGNGVLKLSLPKNSIERKERPVPREAK